MSGSGAAGEDAGSGRGQRGRAIAVAVAVLVMIVSAAGNDAKGLLGSVAVAVAAAGIGTVALRVIDRRRLAAMPPGTIHTAGASLVFHELDAHDQLRRGVSSVPRWAIRWLANGRISGRLAVTNDHLLWVPGRMATFWRVPSLRIPLASVASVVLSSVPVPFDSVRIRLEFAGGGRLTVDSRGAKRLQRALAQTVIADELRTPDAHSGPVWTEDYTTAGPSSPPARLAPMPRTVLIVAWIVLAALLFGLFDPGQESGNFLVDGAADVFVVLAVAAIILTLTRSLRAPRAGAVAGVIGLVASFGDLSLDGVTGAEEVATFTIFLLVCLVVAQIPGEHRRYRTL